MPKILSEGATNHAVGLAPMHHNSGDRGVVGAHDRPGKLGRHAAPRHQAKIGFPVIPVPRVVLRVHDLKILARLHGQPGPFGTAFDHFGPSDQDRFVGHLFQHALRGAQNPFVFALGKYDLPGRGGRRLENRAHQHGRAEDRALQFLPVGLHIGERSGGDTRRHRRLGDRRGHNRDQARIKGFGDQIVAPKGQRLALVGARRLGRGGDARQIGDAVDTGQLHGVVDLGRAHVQRAPENERKAQHVVDLIWIVRPTCGDDRIGRNLARIFGHYFRVRVGQRQNDRGLGHLGDHVFGQYTGAGQPEEKISALHDLAQLCLVGLLGESAFFRVDLVVAHLGDQPLAVGQPDVFALDAHLDQDVQAGDTRRPATRRDDLDFVEFLASQDHRVAGRRADHNRRPVLVVVKDRNIHALAADAFDHETFGRLDVLEVDRAERWLERTDDIGEFLGVGLVHLDVKTIDVGEFLEQNRLAFHHRF